MSQQKNDWLEWKLAKSENHSEIWPWFLICNSFSFASSQFTYILHSTSLHALESLVPPCSVHPKNLTLSAKVRNNTQPSLGFYPIIADGHRVTGLLPKRAQLQSAMR